MSEKTATVVASFESLRKLHLQYSACKSVYQEYSAAIQLQQRSLMSYNNGSFGIVNQQANKFCNALMNSETNFKVVRQEIE